MRKNKILKKGMILGVALSLLVGTVPIGNAAANNSESGSGISESGEASSTNQMLHFVMKIRWGNVIGEPVNISESNFDGSVNVSSDARVSLERTLLFERPTFNLQVQLCG